ncbi:MAG: FAD-binding oxidoreductase [Puniceicoccaceae bacterium]|nr:MAG: FAD-binding oxidoreductase [Puniceicoccaceae bacterium]
MNPGRRSFLKTTTLALPTLPILIGCRIHATGGVRLNDIHSELNPTRVHTLARPASIDDLAATVQRHARRGRPVIASGARHAMGGQQFAKNGLVIDTRGLDQVLLLDRDRGLLAVEAGIQWPALIEACNTLQSDGLTRWGIRQKQTGADTFTIGGSISANIHGRGLTLPPFAADIEDFTLLDSNGDLLRCSRTENAGLFRLAAGGYGLFGVIVRATLRLEPREKVRRDVVIARIDEVIPLLEDRIRASHRFGDFQFSIDESSPDFLRTGVLSSYQPVDPDTPLSQGARLDPEAWLNLLDLAHRHRPAVFDQYAGFYLATNGQIYGSDTHQLSIYQADFADILHARSGADRSTLMISELYVPRGGLPAFMAAAADLLRSSGVPVIYGTVRLIERDEDTFLPWAREPWAGIIFNLRVHPSDSGHKRVRAAFRGLIDLALAQSGSYYLTYHRWATTEQIEAAHPRFRDFLSQKSHYDPAGVFRSDWLDHHRRLLGLPV